MFAIKEKGTNWKIRFKQKNCEKYSMFIAQMENKSKKTMFFIEYTLEMCFIFAEAVQFPKCFRVCILEFFFSLN